MEGRETARMRKYGESNSTGIIMATVPHVTSRLGLRKFQVYGFSLTRAYEDAVNDSTACQSYQTLLHCRGPLPYTWVSPAPTGNLFISFQSAVFSSLLPMSPIISFAEDPFLFCFLPSLRFP